jgi:hypothetical protein
MRRLVRSNSTASKFARRKLHILRASYMTVLYQSRDTASITLSPRCRWTWTRIRSISARSWSSSIGFSFSQSLFDLAPHGHGLPAFLLQMSQAVPQPDDFALSVGVHTSLEQKENEITSR